MPSKHDVIVIGGGIFGATAAVELQRRGHLVRLLDPGPLPNPAASSTDISKIIRMDYGSDEFYMDLMETALEGWRAWNEQWPIPLYHETGFLILTRSPLESGTFEGDSYAMLQSRGHRPERLEAADLRQRFPAWSGTAVIDGYFNPEAGWVESARALAQILRQAEAEGVEVDQGESARAIERQGERLTGIRTSSGLISADTVVLAAGAWSGELLPPLRDKVWPVGQPVFHFRAPDIHEFQAPSFLPWAVDIAETGWYGFPALDDGTLKVANHGPGSRVHPSERSKVPAGEEARFRGFFTDHLPALVDAPSIGSRLCFYADSWDGNFYIDSVPEYEGLTLATGGSGHGLKFAPILGKLIADVVEGEENPYGERFRWRSAGQRQTEQARFA